jgi:oligopeptide/dipeptide ABC transporter ATP-binding protein
MALPPRDRAGQTLEIRNLSIAFSTPRGHARVVDNVSLSIGASEIVGVIGESGSGKTVTALAALGMLPRGARIESGRILLGGESLLDMTERERRAMRGDRVAYIPQDALRSLNPTLRIGVQVGEPLALHRAMTWDIAKRKAVELLAAVRLRDPGRRAEEYPHQFSGGMQQRAMIAMGLCLEPQLLIADEPTTALDVTVQAQVLQLVRDIRKEHGTSIFFITHDLGVVADLCDRVYVMYAGAIVEEGPVDRIFDRPSHPYTRGLLRATPAVHGSKEALVPIPGQIPLATERPEGCRFVDRCAFAIAPCRSPPPWVEIEVNHRVLCVRAGDAELAA